MCEENIGEENTVSKNTLWKNTVANGLLFYSPWTLGLEQRSEMCEENLGEENTVSKNTLRKKYSCKRPAFRFPLDSWLRTKK